MMKKWTEKKRWQKVANEQFTLDKQKNCFFFFLGFK